MGIAGLTSGVGNIVGGIGDVAGTGFKVGKEKVEFVSKGANRVSNSLSNAAKVLGEIGEGGNLNQIPGKLIGGTVNITTDIFGNIIMGSSGDAINTASNVIGHGMDLGSKTLHRVVNFTSDVFKPIFGEDNEESNKKPNKQPQWAGSNFLKSFLFNKKNQNKPQLGGFKPQTDGFNAQTDGFKPHNIQYPKDSRALTPEDLQRIISDILANYIPNPEEKDAIQTYLNEQSLNSDQATTLKNLIKRYLEEKYSTST